jgi:peptide deformylase
MAVKKILLYPDPVLKTPSEKIDVITAADLQATCDLVDTMHASPGVGLAAVQIGILKRIITVDISERNPEHELIVLINPEIIERSGKKKVREGCLSVPDYLADITRAKKITVKGLDRDGKELEICTSGFEAIVLQHEIDHLDGILFIDRIESIKSLTRRITDD